MTYRPLPKSVTIGKSTIEGLGLIALEFIPAQTCLGPTHFYETNRPGIDWIRTPLGGFYNHSEKPNCETQIVRKIDSDIPDFMELWTIHDIFPGEEITCRYTLYKVDMAK